MKHHINRIADLMLCRVYDKRGKRVCHLVSVKSCPEEIEKKTIMWQRLYISSHLSNTSWNGRKTGMNMYHGVLENDR